MGGEADLELDFGSSPLFPLSSLAPDCGIACPCGKAASTEREEDSRRAFGTKIGSAVDGRARLDADWKIEDQNPTLFPFL